MLLEVLLVSSAAGAVKACAADIALRFSHGLFVRSDAYGGANRVGNIVKVHVGSVDNQVAGANGTFRGRRKSAIGIGRRFQARRGGGTGATLPSAIFLMHLGTLQVTLLGTKRRIQRVDRIHHDTGFACILWKRKILCGRCD
jgi:hypothetical protein